MRAKLKRLFPYAVLSIVLLLAAPLVARIGSTQTLRKWTSTPGDLGLSRPLTLSFQKSVAYVDVLALYPTYRLSISDGGYEYVHQLEIHTADVIKFVQGCQVRWDTDKVEFTMPTGETLAFPTQAVIQQVGP